MTTSINEPVDVIFSSHHTTGRVMPRKLQWRGREYQIEEVGYHHRLKDGTKLLHIFSVSNTTLAFRLKLDTETLHWVLEEISDSQ